MQAKLNDPEVTGNYWLKMALVKLLFRDVDDGLSACAIDMRALDVMDMPSCYYVALDKVKEERGTTKPPVVVEEGPSMLKDLLKKPDVKTLFDEFKDRCTYVNDDDIEALNVYYGAAFANESPTPWTVEGMEGNDGFHKIGKCCMPGGLKPGDYKKVKLEDDFLEELHKVIPEAFVEKDVKQGLSYKIPVKNDRNTQRAAFVQQKAYKGPSKKGYVKAVVDEKGLKEIPIMKRQGLKSSSFMGALWSRWPTSEPQFDRFIEREELISLLKKNLGQMEGQAGVGPTSAILNKLGFPCDGNQRRHVEVYHDEFLHKVVIAQLFVYDFLSYCMDNECMGEACYTVFKWFLDANGQDLINNCVSLGFNVTVKTEMHSDAKVAAGRIRNIQFPDYVGSLIDHMLYKPQNGTDKEHFPKLPTKVGIGFTEPLVTPVVHDFATWENMFQSDVKGFDSGVLGSAIVRDAMRRSFCSVRRNKARRVKTRYADHGMFIIRAMVVLKSPLVMPGGDVVSRSFEGQIFSGWANTSSSGGYVRVESSALVLQNPYQNQCSLGDDDVEEMVVGCRKSEYDLFSYRGDKEFDYTDVIKQGGTFTLGMETLGHTIKRDRKTHV